MDELLDRRTLESSSVVANCAMNRERGLDSYGKELGLDIVGELAAHSAGRAVVRWLDLCCGTGRALIEGARRVGEAGVTGRIEIVGVDLVDFFAPVPDGLLVRLVTGSVNTWSPSAAFDLVTCVHGLHYVGDKLGALARAASWLTGDGLLVANLDAADIRLVDAGHDSNVDVRPAEGRTVGAALRRAGMEYDARRHRVRCHGRREVTFPFLYRGASDRAGPNYTGQPAVRSFYARVPRHA